jgi:ElaB/YqjD/DUF883 family membrane-anchored ribosome-binding protein
VEANGKTNYQPIDGSSDGAKKTEQVSSTAHQAVDRLASGAHRTVDRLSAAAGSAIGSLSQGREQVTVKGSELVDEVRNYVQANPLASIGIAAAAGFILSRIIGSSEAE